MPRSSTILTVAVAAALGLAAAAFFTQWVVVDVHPGGHHAFRLPLPLPMIRAAVALVPERAYENARVPEELAAHRRAITEAVAILRDCPDTTFVAFHCDDASVSVSKNGRSLRVDIDSHHDKVTVRCRIPLDGLGRVLDDWDWETLDPGVLLGILAEAPRGPLVDVVAPDTLISVSIW